MAHTNELATNITARINVTEAVPNVDINYGPYDSVHDAFQTLSEYGAVAQGLTVGVRTNGSIQEYWFKSGVTESDLVEKLASQGTMDYNDLSNKPKIGTKTLDSSTTLAQIGAASSTDLSNHTSNAKIHVPMTYGGTTTAIDGLKIEGEKLTITVGSSEYSFRLTEWHDIADFYVLYGNMTYTSGTWKITINNETKDFSNVTINELLSLKDNEFGYVVSSEKQDLNVTTVGVVPCDYIREELPDNTNTLMILYRTTGGSLPTLTTVVSTNAYSGEYQYNLTTSVDNFNPNLVGNYTVEGIGYRVKVYPNAATGDTWGITFNK